MGAARTALNVAARRSAGTGPCGGRLHGRATIEIRAAAEPGADGGQDLVIDVTAAIWPDCTVASLAAGRVAHATPKTTAMASSTAPGRARRRIRVGVSG